MKPGLISRLRALSPHLLSFYFPATTLAFVFSGPHSVAVALAYLVPGFLAFAFDHYSGKEERQPPEDVRGAPFTALLLAHFVAQMASMVGLVRLFARVDVAHAAGITDALVAVIVVGSSSSYSGIVASHELIHRLEKWLQQLGRIILLTVFYEHLYTEHIRGHHVRYGTPEDNATARFGETFNAFYARVVPAQLKSAWRLEAKRLGDPAMVLFDRRTLRNRVFHGLVGAWGVALVVLFTCGPVALAVYLAQAVYATRLLEVTQYFEHWGLTRAGRRADARLSWDADSRFTYYALTGIARHADHHAHPTRPYQELRLNDVSPRMPLGYFVMGMLAVVWNARFQELMTAELRRLGLAPVRGTEGFRHGVQPYSESGMPSAAMPRG